MSGYRRDYISGVPHDDYCTRSVETTIHGLPTYVVRPEGKSKGLIVIISDAFGWKQPNSRVLADKYAKAGFLVYLPEFMDGHSVSPKMFSIVNALIAPSSFIYTISVKPVLVMKCLFIAVPFIFCCRLSVAKPRIFDFFKALRTSPETSNMKIGAAGFCWGWKYTVLLAQDMPSSRVHRPDTQAGQAQRLIDCAFTAHPSMLDVPKDIEPVTVPLSIAVGDVEMALKADLVYKTKEILEKKAGDHEVVIYPGAKHGFAIKGDPTDPKQKVFGEQAEAQAVSWFSQWFST